MKIISYTLFSLVILCFHISGKAQSVNPETFPDLKEKLITSDSLFWEAYNHCDTEAMNQYFTEDLEFYHDKSGLTSTRAALHESVENGLCGNPDWRLRREAVPGTIEIYPIENYGAVFRGKHLFYINEKNKDEYLDGHAQFTHLWKYDSGEWKMSRVLSYDHKPAQYRFTKTEVELSSDVLDKYTGRYKSENGIIIDVVIDDKTLILKTKQNDFVLNPEAENLFFIKDRALQVKFKNMENGQSQNLIILENGKMVDEAERMN